MKRNLLRVLCSAALVSMTSMVVLPHRVFAVGATATVAVSPCALTYGTPLAANVPLGIEVRGYCGIPSNATAIFVHIKAGNSTPAGKMYFWPDGESLPTYSQFNFQNAVSPNPVSGHALVRLGGGTADAVNLWVQSNVTVNLSVVVEGYIAPSS